MFCINCGREWKDGEVYCGSCGALRSSQAITQQVNTVSQPKKGLPTWAIILIIIGSVVFAGIIGFVLLIFFVFLVIDSTSLGDIYEQTESYVYIGSEAIPTLYEFDTEYELCDYPDYDYDDGEEVVEYSYCDAFIDTNVFDNYLDYLVEEYDFIDIYDDSDSRTISKYTDDGLYYISVSVDYYEESIEYISVDSIEMKEDNSI